MKNKIKLTNTWCQLTHLLAVSYRHAETTSMQNETLDKLKNMAKVADMFVEFDNHIINGELFRMLRQFGANSTDNIKTFEFTESVFNVDCYKIVTEHTEVLLRFNPHMNTFQTEPEIPGSFGDDDFNINQCSITLMRCFIQCRNNVLNTKTTHEGNNY